MDIVEGLNAKVCTIRRRIIDTYTHTIDRIGNNIAVFIDSIVYLKNMLCRAVACQLLIGEFHIQRQDSPCSTIRLSLRFKVNDTAGGLIYIGFGQIDPGRVFLICIIRGRGAFFQPKHGGIGFCRPTDDLIHVRNLLCLRFTHCIFTLNLPCTVLFIIDFFCDLKFFTHVIRYQHKANHWRGVG